MDLFLMSIINNMSKLINSPISLCPFLPKLLSGLIKVETTIGDPEACSIVGHAIATLCQIGKVPTGDASDLTPLKLAKASQLVQSLALLYQKAGASPVPFIEDKSVIYTLHLAANLVNAKNFKVY
jgi:elongation factor 3